MRRTAILILAAFTLLFAACDFSQYVPEKTGTEVAQEAKEQFDSLNGYIFGVQGKVPETVAIERSAELKLFNEPTEDPDYPVFHEMVFENYQLKNTGEDTAVLQLAVPALTNLRDYATYRREIKVDGEVPENVTTVFSDPLFFGAPEAEMGDNELYEALLNTALSDGVTVPRALDPTLVADRPITVFKIGGMPDAELVEGETPSYTVTFSDIDPATVTSCYFWGGSWDETSKTRMYSSHIPARDDRMKDAYLIFFDRVPKNVEVNFFADGALEQPLEPIEHDEEWFETTLYEFIPQLYLQDLELEEQSDGANPGWDLAREPEEILHLLTPYLEHLLGLDKNMENMGQFELYDAFAQARVDDRLIFELVDVEIPAGQTAQLDLSYEIQNHFNHYGTGKNPKLLGFELYRRTVNDIPYRETTFTLDIEADGYTLLNPLADLVAQGDSGRYRGVANIRQNFAVLIEREDND